MSNHENYGHFEVRQPIGLVRSENGEVSVPSKLSRRPTPFQPLGSMNSVFRAKRVSSSTTPKGVASSETLDGTAQTEYSEFGMSGADKHFMSLLESPDISTDQANNYFNDYYS